MGYARTIMGWQMKSGSTAKKILEGGISPYTNQPLTEAEIEGFKRNVAIGEHARQLAYEFDVRREKQREEERERNKKWWRRMVNARRNR